MLSQVSVLCCSRNLALPFAAIYEQPFPLLIIVEFCDLSSVFFIVSNSSADICSKQTTWNFIDTIQMTAVCKKCVTLSVGRYLSKCRRPWILRNIVRQKIFVEVSQAMNIA